MLTEFVGVLDNPPPAKGFQEEFQKKDEMGLVGDVRIASCVYLTRRPFRSSRNLSYGAQISDRSFILLESAIKRFWLKSKLQMTPGHFRITYCVSFIAILRTKHFIHKTKRA